MGHEHMASIKKVTKKITRKQREMTDHETLAALVKKYGTVKFLSEFPHIEVEENDKAAVLRIDMAAAGYFKPHVGLSAIISDLFPEHVSDGDEMDENGVLTIYLADKAKKEQSGARNKELELKAHAHIKEAAELHCYGDTTMPDSEKEVICKVVFSIPDYFAAPSGEYEGLETWFWSVAKLHLSNYEWSYASGGYIVGDKVHVVLVSKAFWKRRLRELGESVCRC